MATFNSANDIVNSLLGSNSDLTRPSQSRPLLRAIRENWGTAPKEPLLSSSLRILDISIGIYIQITTHYSLQRASRQVYRNGTGIWRVSSPGTQSVSLATRVLAVTFKTDRATVLNVTDMHAEASALLNHSRSCKNKAWQCLHRNQSHHQHHQSQPPRPFSQRLIFHSLNHCGKLLRCRWTRYQTTMMSFHSQLYLTTL